MENITIDTWKDFIGHPANYDFEPKAVLLKRYDFGETIGELYSQVNAPGTSQRVLMLFPKNVSCPMPGVVVPFYFPEGMLGFELESREVIANYRGIEMMMHLASRGYVTISADAFHLTYDKNDLARDDFQRWTVAAEHLLNDHPGWTGIGKLIADTRLITDMLAADPRVDATRIGIAGHSLGGKMAFYAGCLDSRIRAILTSDFGFLWDQTNWEDIWYWGKRLENLKASGMEHSSLLATTNGKPFCLLAGKYDDKKSGDALRSIAAYQEHPECLEFINHATGHRPPADVLQKGYDFLDRFLK